MNRASRALAIKLNEIVFRTKSTPVAIALRALCRMPRTIVDTKHGKFWIDPLSHFGYFILRDGEYEPDLSQIVETNIRPGAVVIDCGAHEGYFAILASRKVGPTGRVIACEPQSRVREVLLENIKLNGIDNIRVVPWAISDRRGTALMHLTAGHNTGGSGLAQGTSRLPEKTETVEMSTLTDIAAELRLNRVDFVKMDIEGFEYEAILGSPSLFENRLVSTLALELHGKHMERRSIDPKSIRSFLESCGYALDMSQSQNLDTFFATMIFRSGFENASCRHPNSI